MKSFQYSPDCLFLFRCHLRHEMCVKNSSHYYYLFADIWTQIHNAMKIHLSLQTFCNVRSYQIHKTFTLQVLSTNDQENILPFFLSRSKCLPMPTCKLLSMQSSGICSKFPDIPTKKVSHTTELQLYRQAGAVDPIQQLSDYRSLRGSDLRRT